MDILAYPWGGGNLGNDDENDDGEENAAHILEAFAVRVVTEDGRVHLVRAHHL